MLWAPVLGSENLLVVLLLAGAATALSPARSTRTAVVAGALLGLGVLVRPEALFCVLAVPVVVMVTATGRRELAWRSFVVVGVAALAVVPWYVRNEIVVGRGAGLSTTGGMNFYLAHRAGGYGWTHLGGTPLAGLDGVATDRRGYTLGFEQIRRRPWTLVTRAARGTYELNRPPRHAAYYSTRTRGERPPYRAGVSTGAVKTPGRSRCGVGS